MIAFFLMVEGEGVPVLEMSRQDVIDALSGNRRRTTNRAGQAITIIERIDRPTDSGESADLFTPPESVQEPQG